MTNWDVVQKEPKDLKYLRLRDRLIFNISKYYKIMHRINNQKFWDALRVHELKITKGEKDAGYL